MNTERCPAAAVPARTCAICLAVLLLAVLTAGGCARTAPRSAAEQREIEDLWARHQRQTMRLSEWALQGRMAVRTSDESWSAGLRWRQRNDTYRVRVMAPLGRGTVEIAGDDAGVSLRTPQNEVLTAADPSALLTEHLGFELPVESIRYWMRGLPAPGLPIRHMELDGQGRLAQLEQGAWSLAFSRYADLEQYQLPGRIFLESEHLEVRLAVQQWRGTFE